MGKLQIRSFKHQDESHRQSVASTWVACCRQTSTSQKFQKSHLKHLYVLRTTSTSMAGSNLLQNPKFTEKFSHQLSTQRFRRSFSCIQRWKQKFQKNHSFSHPSFAALVFLALFLKNSNLRSSVMASANIPLFTSIK